MKCPVCKEITLVMAERQGIEVDYCPQCRGVWLDRGELDKLIERAVAAPASSKFQASQKHSDSHEYLERRYDDDHDYQRRKKRGFLGEVFDIFD